MPKYELKESELMLLRDTLDQQRGELQNMIEDSVEDNDNGETAIDSPTRVFQKTVIHDTAGLRRAVLSVLSIPEAPSSQSLAEIYQTMSSIYSFRNSMYSIRSLLRHMANQGDVETSKRAGTRDTFYALSPSALTREEAKHRSSGLDPLVPKPKTRRKKRRKPGPKPWNK